jgi:predicted membrane-bound spermidine synthase
MKKENLLYTVIFLEGFVVLATELLSIRLLMPFVGNGTEVIAIIISAILLPLAFGYNYAGTQHKNKSRVSIRKKLIHNLIISIWILTFGLSYIIQEMFFSLLTAFHLKNHILQTTIFCLTFLVYPVFLLGQTVPLVSNYFLKRKLSEVTGRILFFSTSGSFIGSVFTTLVLMMTIGVHKTVVVVLLAIALIVILLNKKLLTYESYMSCLALFIGFFLNINAFGYLNFVSNNAYNMIAIEETQDSRDLQVNRSYSSRYSKVDSRGFEYIKFVEDNFINQFKEPKSILVIGAGGFTVGLSDAKNHYTFIDIDPDILKVSEEEFLKQKLGSNKEFVAMSARAFLKQTEKKYDFIFIDAYSHILSLPYECTTQEFYQSVKDHLNVDGLVVANIVGLPDFQDKFSSRINNTFASVFWPFSREVLRKNNLEKKSDYANVIFIYHDRKDVYDDVVYTDDKNSYSLDRKAM